MNRHARYLEQQALNKHLEEWTEGHTVFGTLKFANGFLTPEEKADKAHRLFWQKVDRTYFPTAAVKSGIRIPRVCFKHFGCSGENIHYHFTANVGDIFTFRRVAEVHWKQSDKHTGTIQIETIRDRTDARHYLAHEYTSIGSKTLDETTTHWNVPEYDAGKYKTISQLRRLLKTHESYSDTFNT